MYTKIDKHNLFLCERILVYACFQFIESANNSNAQAFNVNSL